MHLRRTVWVVAAAVATTASAQPAPAPPPQPAPTVPQPAQPALPAPPPGYPVPQPYPAAPQPYPAAPPQPYPAAPPQPLPPCPPSAPTTSGGMPSMPGGMPGGYPPSTMPGAMPGGYPPSTMPGAPTAPAMPGAAAAPAMPGAPMAPQGCQPAALPPPPVPKKQGPKFGDFDAGGQFRLPNGPDESGKYATFNWVAVDLRGRFTVASFFALDAWIPLAVKKPDMLGAEDPRIFGGIRIKADLHLPNLGNVPGMSKSASDIGLVFEFAEMRDGALLLSDKDFPLFVNGFHPGFLVGPKAKIKLSSLLDFSLVPQFVYQAGPDSTKALQVPLALTIGLADLVKLNIDAGIYTGDNFSLRPSHDGRIAAGASLDVKLWRLLAHAGAGFASLFTSDEGPYPTISDSFYVEANVKYVK